MGTRRAKQPIDRVAAGRANEALYERHPQDPRPNALFDESGNRKRLSATDPAQSALREEWMDEYVAHGGPVETVPEGGKRVGATVAPCPYTWIEVQLLDDDGNPVPGEKYSVRLPDGRTVAGTLDQDGLVRIVRTVRGVCKVTFPNLDEKAWQRVS